MAYQNARWIAILILICCFCYGNSKSLRSIGDLRLAMDIIEQEYVEPIDKTQLYQAAMRGMIQSLDRYSSYVPPEFIRPFNAVINQEYCGIGIITTARDPMRPAIVEVLYNSPAYQAGILPGDIILEIDGQRLSTDKGVTVGTMLNGEEGTTVHLKIERTSQAEPLSFHVKRAQIETESVLGDRRKSNGLWEFSMEADPRIAYLRIELFGEKTAGEVKKALASVGPACRGIIIDLRDNSGGLLKAATTICDMFLDDGDIVMTVGRGDIVESKTLAEVGTEVPNDVPIVILVNSDSASASEVVSACLEDRSRATIVGERSFGKGCVQNVIPLDAGSSAMNLTTAYYFPPSGRMIHRREGAKDSEIWGVCPKGDCLIELSREQKQAVDQRLRQRAIPSSNSSSATNPTSTTDSSNATPSETLSIRGDPTLSMDPQLQKAVELLQAKLSAAK